MRVTTLGLRIPAASKLTRASSSSSSSASSGSTMAAGGAEADVATLLHYHEETKHSFRRYARGPHGLDWANQPNPFRRYAGARLVPLEHLPELPSQPTDVAWSALSQDQPSPRPLDKRSLSQLLYDSLALSAWKVAGRSTWSLRVNPSSGNLHPTEGYVLGDAIAGVSDVPFVAHYAPKDHALEIRAALPAALWRRLTSGLPRGSLLLAFSSILWRESWKYGERAFRYCNHDVGHAIGAVAIAAASLGWSASLLDGYSCTDLGALLGLAPPAASCDRGPAKGVMRELEAEHADCILALIPSGEEVAGRLCYGVAEAMTEVEWRGERNELSREHVRWGIVYEAAQASEKKAVTEAAVVTRSVPLRSEVVTDAEYEPLSVRQVVRKRRSAVSMDGTYGMRPEVFYQMLAKTLPTGGGEETQGAPRQLPFGALPWHAEVHLAIFVHRVVGLPSGMYLLVRNEAHAKELQKEMAEDFVWEKPQKCPSGLPLFALQYGDCKELAQRLSCDQEIAGDGFFSLGMLARFEPALKEFGPSMYTRLFWETGLIGQVLYLEAHAFGVSATGIGCFFDDPVHQVLGLKDKKFQSLYHFTVGVPTIDKRIQQIPAYPGPVNANS